MIFLDTSAIYSLADVRDEMHIEALRIFEAAEKANEEILTHSYVLVESTALLQKRLGLNVALAFLQESTNFTIVWVDNDLHGAGVEHLKQAKLSGLSLVDAISFVVMRDTGVATFMGFDKHFSDAGFIRYKSV